jgi:hypothetical protein
LSVMMPVADFCAASTDPGAGVELRLTCIVSDDSRTKSVHVAMVIEPFSVLAGIAVASVLFVAET